MTFCLLYRESKKNAIKDSYEKQSAVFLVVEIRHAFVES
jgi:hypothetical protein